MDELNLTLADYRTLQDLVNRQMDYWFKLPESGNRQKKLSSLLSLAQKIDKVCHDIMCSEVNINGC